jgi:hypothetical protein
VIVSAIALTVVCAASFTIIPMLWAPRSRPRAARATTRLSLNLARPGISALTKSYAGPHNPRAAYQIGR